MTPIEYALLFTILAALLGSTLIAVNQSMETGRTVFLYRHDTGACSGWASLINGRIEYRVYDPRIESLFNKSIIVPDNSETLLPPSAEQAKKGSARILIPGSIDHFTAAVTEIRSLGYYAVVTTAAVNR